MKVKVFSLNRYKSYYIKQGNLHLVKHPPNWAIVSSDCEVIHGDCMIGKDGIWYQTEQEWISYVDEKYVRR